MMLILFPQDFAVPWTLLFSLSQEAANRSISRIPRSGMELTPAGVYEEPQACRIRTDKKTTGCKRRRAAEKAANINGGSAIARWGTV
ncbi:hypothetical protein Y1Q_0005616 [Alligator mississippiensis]|uniref:Uncharacterized protein n=1 Tax=Alligator mississippiensis TaxID=8496 RepID=A0A151MF87_ALLMI|nr:hypothetical protein Y1Q_0005616 [Alligator mississippiensis]